MRVLVAGATGYLGRHVVRAFKARGWWIRALVRDRARLDRPDRFLAPAVGGDVDDVVEADVTRPEALEGVCDDVDVVFSAVGITRQREGVSFHDVDYLGNLNLLRVACDAAVRRFVYVSVFNAHRYERLAIIRAHEDFVRALAASGMPHTVVRPTAYFSDMSEFLRMARSGWALLIGDGENRLNPIHGADLAEVCAEAVLASGDGELPAGGPEVFSQNGIARLAFDVLGRRGRIVHVPPVLGRAAVKLVRPFDRHLSDLIDFFVTAGQGEAVAPARGTRRLREYFEELLAAAR